MEKSETIAKLAEALCTAQGVMENAIKDSKNPFFKSSYADLASVIEVSREPLRANGLSYSQTFEEDNNTTFLRTTLMHKSGEWISSKMKLILNKNDMQQLGSAATYARRYSLSAIIGITQEDDDGNKASHGDEKVKKFNKEPNQTKEMEQTNQPAIIPEGPSREQLAALFKTLPNHDDTVRIIKEYLGMKKLTNTSQLTMAQYNELMSIIESSAWANQGGHIQDVRIVK